MKDHQKSLYSGGTDKRTKGKKTDRQRDSCFHNNILILSHNDIKISFYSESEAATKLESEKKTARSKSDNKRKKFQGQDSVLNESINASQARLGNRKHLFI